MNELVEQFLVESLELVQRATDDLSALERTPENREALDSAFRAFHTLKGGAAIIGFGAMERVLHAAEDILAAARTRGSAVSPATLSDCVACLDQVSRWLDAMGNAGEVPVGAEAQAGEVLRRFTRADHAPAAWAPDATRSIDADWLRELTRRHPDAAARARTAIRYRPEADCFFQAEDPLAVAGAVRGLLKLDIKAVTPWEPLEALGPVAAQCELVALDDSGAQAAPRAARDVLEEQLRLLSEPSAREAQGHVHSAARVAANVLTHLGRKDEAGRIASAAARGAHTEAMASLREAIQSALQSAQRTASVPAPVHVPTDMAIQTLRVDATRIDQLVKLTGELGVVKNALGQLSKEAEAGHNPLAQKLKNWHGAMDRLVGELQAVAVGMRVLPLRHALQRFPRLVREMAGELGKPARLVIEGDETEADKAIVEVLVEPLLHVVRNAMDHGIESPEERAAAGKPPAATIVLRAARQGEHVVLEILDDGRGIDLARVRQVALQRGVVTPEALASMSDAQVTELVFEAGFSTARQVSGVSGRGVGMDAVRSAVQRLGGRVQLESRPQLGTTVRITLPFSVMMTSVMTVEAGGQLFGIPLDAMVETLRVARTGIFSVGAGQAIVLREQTVPLVDLSGTLGLGRPGGGSDHALVVVVRLGGSVGALQVDRLGERMEVMLKPLDGLLAAIPGIAGSTLLGDGSVLLVLDLAELLQ